MPLVWAALAWVGVGSLWILCRARKARARRQPLTYGWTLPQAKGLAGVGRNFARSMEALTWGSSYDVWRARCAASLRASRKRRGLPV